MNAKNQTNPASSSPANHKRPFWSFITNNFWLKVFSLLFAILLWSYVINQTDPERNKTFIDLPVYVSGVTQLSNNRLVPLDDLTAKMPKVAVTVSVRHSKYSSIASSNIQVTADLSQITSTGFHTVPIRVSSNSSDITIVSYSPQTVDVTIDELASSIVPVKLRTTGTLPTDLTRGEPVITPKPVKINGPKTYISKIAQAQITVDLSQMTDSYSASLPYSYVDAANNMISSATITADTNVALVDMSIKTLKTVPVDYISALTNMDKMAEGYYLKGSQISQQTVVLSAPADKLAQIEKITVKPVDLTGLSENVNDITLEPILPAGVEIYNSQAITLNLTVEEKTITKTFEVKITYTNTPLSLKAQSDFTSVTVLLTGKYFTLQNVKSSDITAEVDLNGLHAGTAQRVSIAAKLVHPLNSVTMDTQPSEIYVDLVTK